jgi:hypothetical protein
LATKRVGRTPAFDQNALRETPLLLYFDDKAVPATTTTSIGLEGVVSKRRDAPYRSDERGDWVKVKTLAWRDANREQWRLFER